MEADWQYRRCKVQRAHLQYHGKITWIPSAIWNIAWLWWRIIRRIRIIVLWKNFFPGLNSCRKSAGAKQKQWICKPTAGNDGHKKDWYSWPTVYHCSGFLIVISAYMKFFVNNNACDFLPGISILNSCFLFIDTESSIGNFFFQFFEKHSFNI